MTKERKNELRKKMLTSTLIASMFASLSGCGKTNQNQQTTTQQSSTIQQEQIQQEDSNSYEQLAMQSYSQYREFYDYIGIDVIQVENMIKIINDDLTGLTEDDLNDAIYLMDQIILSDTLIQAIDNTKNNIPLTFTPAQAPTLTPFINNEEVKQDVLEYEVLRDSIQQSAVNGNITEQDKQNLAHAIVKMEKSYNNDQGHMNSEVDSEGINYVKNLCNRRLTYLTVLATNGTNIIDSEGNDFKIAMTDEESDKLALYESLDRNGQEIPLELANEIFQIKASLIYTKYEEGMCSNQEQMYQKIQQNSNMSNTQSKNNVLKKIM